MTAKMKYPTGSGYEIVGTDADKVDIQDSGGIIEATNVEGALQEIVTDLNGHIGSGGPSHALVVSGGNAGFMSGADKQKIDFHDVQLSDDDPVPVSLAPSTQIVDAPRKSRVSNIGFGGRTLVNLLGRDGNCESLAPFSISAGTTPTLSTTQKKSGSNSIKISPSGTTSYVYKDYGYKLDATKRYIVGAWVYVESWTSGTNAGVFIHDYGVFAGKYGAAVNLSKVGLWQFVYAKIPVGNTVVGNGFRLLAGASGVSTGVVYFDDIRLYELSAADYDAIGTTYTTAEQVAAKYPYVDGMKHTEAVHITNPGKNLVSPFSGWNLNANAVVTSAYELTLNATGAANDSVFSVPAVEDQTYSFSLTHNSIIYIQSMDALGNEIIRHVNGTSAQFATFTTPVGTKLIRITLGSVGAGTFTFSNPMLNIGAVALPFETQQESHLYLWDLGLVSNVDRSVRDELYMEDGNPRVTRQFWSEVLDGTQSVLLASNYTGFKAIVIDVGKDAIDNTGVIVKYDGKVIKTQSANVVFTNGDQAWNGDVSTGFTGKELVLTVSMSDSGWGDDYSPTADEIKLYIDGWKMYESLGSASDPYTGTGTKAWIKRISKDVYDTPTGTITQPPSGISVWPSGFTPYRLMYQLAQSKDEAVSHEGELMVHDGLNQIHMGTGIVVREAVSPVEYGGNWFINRINAVNSQLNNRVSSILNIFKNGVVEKRWSRDNTTGYSYGNEMAMITGANYDQTAAYSVTYLALDTYLIGIAPQSITADIVPNIKEAVDDLTRGLTEAKTQISVLQNVKGDKQLPQWITATLLNAWIANINNGIQYRLLDEKTLQLRVAIHSGVGTVSTALTRIPYKPSLVNFLDLVTYDTITDVSPILLKFDVDGSLSIDAVSTAAKDFITGWAIIPLD